MTMLVTETMVEAFQSKYREIAKRCNWGDSWPAGDEVRELLCASMTPTQPTATTTEALRLPEGTLSMQGNDITIAYATREDAERAFDVLEAALSTAPSGDGMPGMVLDESDHHCPICTKAFEPADLCSTDIEMGTCHAACLEGSPTVDLDTGEPMAGPIPTYRYDGEKP